MSTSESGKVTVEEAPEPAGNEILEERATEIARREGRDQVTDQDRQGAFDELKSTGQKNPADGEASH